MEVKANSGFKTPLLKIYSKLTFEKPLLVKILVGLKPHAAVAIFLVIIMRS